ncbi:MAG TPA: hypothetical protein VEG31_00900 [Thermoproteota archaeon]|nr:hypothetical protein [Thermoproteota archaeon]
MPLVGILAKLYSVVLLGVGAVIVYMGYTSQTELGGFWMYFVGLGVLLAVIGFVGLVLKLTEKQ